MATDIVFHDEILRVTDATVEHLASGLFRNLTNEEEDVFISNAKAMPEGIKVNPLWHPIIQDYLLTTGRGDE